MLKNTVVVSLCLAAFLAARVHSSDVQPPKKGAETAKKIRKKYSDGGFVRDMDHIKEDLRHLIEFSDDGTFTAEESIFYLVRMHDFDDNNQLDGLELMRAFGHAQAHDGTQNEAEDVMAQLVDETMQFDTNLDGMLSYPEWVKGYKE